MEDIKVVSDEKTADVGSLDTVSFKESRSQIIEHYKIIMRKTLTKRVIGSIVAAFLVFAIYVSESPILSAAVSIGAGIVCFILSSLIIGFSLKAQAKKQLARVDVSRSEYRFTKEYVEFSGYEYDELVFFRRILYEDIISVNVSDTAINFVSGGMSYILPRDIIPGGSNILSFLEGCKARKAVVRTEQSDIPLSEALTPREIFKLLLSASSTLALLSALFVIFSQIHYSESVWWIPFILLVFPATYFVLYVISKISGISTKRYATVLAVISAFILTVSPLTGMSIANASKESEAAAMNIFETYTSLTGIEIPSDGEIFSHTDSAYLEGADKWVDITVASSYMDSEDKTAVSAFRAKLTESSGWLSPTSALLEGDYEKILGEYTYYDKVIIFNATSGEYNKPISADGATYYIATYEASSHCISVYMLTLE